MSERWIQISAGRGPRECGWVVARLAEALIAETGKEGIETQLLETGMDRDDVVRSMLLSLSGPGTEDFAATVEGTMQWIGTSPFRPKHKRRNWFVKVSILPVPEDAPELDPTKLRFTAMRASGPGGQHVNTTDSAVRLEHLPTGLVTVAREERSQHANKRLALAKLARLLADEEDRKRSRMQKDSWDRHNSLERGNAIRVYQGPKFRRQR